MVQSPNTTAFHLRQAAFIAIGIIVAIGATIHALDHDGSRWWLLVAYVAIVIPSGPMMLRTLNVIGAAIGSLEGPLAIIIGFAVLLTLLPALASAFLIVALVQAVRHR